MKQNGQASSILRGACTLFLKILFFYLFGLYNLQEVPFRLLLARDKSSGNRSFPAVLHIEETNYGKDDRPDKIYHKVFHRIYQANIQITAKP